VVVQAKFREIAKTITTPRFLVFLAISRTPKKMSEPGVIKNPDYKKINNDLLHHERLFNI
jgi:hypothetical protein